MAKVNREATETTMVGAVSRAEAQAALENVARFGELLLDLRKVVGFLGTIEQAEGAALSRQRAAEEAALKAEQDCESKLTLYAGKIQRASEESDRILAKAKQDANAMVATAQADAAALLDPAKRTVLELQAQEGSLRAVISQLNRDITALSGAKDELDKAIAAAKAQIHAFTGTSVDGN